MEEELESQLRRVGACRCCVLRYKGVPFHKVSAYVEAAAADAADAAAAAAAAVNDNSASAAACCPACLGILQLDPDPSNRPPPSPLPLSGGGGGGGDDDDDDDDVKNVSGADAQKPAAAAASADAAASAAASTAPTKKAPPAAASERRQTVRAMRQYVDGILAGGHVVSTFALEVTLPPALAVRQAALRAHLVETAAGGGGGGSPHRAEEEEGEEGEGGGRNIAKLLPQTVEVKDVFRAMIIPALESAASTSQSRRRHDQDADFRFAL